MSADLDRWVDRMIESYPGALPDEDATPEEQEVFARRLVMWATATDKSAGARLLRRGAEAVVEGYMDEMVAEGKAVRHVADDGTVSYSKVGA